MRKSLDRMLGRDKAVSSRLSLHLNRAASESISLASTDSQPAIERLPQPYALSRTHIDLEGALTHGQHKSCRCSAACRFIRRLANGRPRSDDRIVDLYSQRDIREWANEVHEEGICRGYAQGWNEGYGMGRRSFDRARAEGYRVAKRDHQARILRHGAKDDNKDNESSLPSSVDAREKNPMRVQWWYWRLRAWICERLEGRKHGYEVLPWTKRV